MSEASPARRAAPRPLAAHVSALAADLGQGVALAARAGDPRFPWRPSLRAEAAAIAAALATAPESAQARAVAEAALRDVGAALDGMHGFQETPALRRPPRPPAVWGAGVATAHDYALIGPKPVPKTAPTALVLPSLINGPTVLDISRARSFLRGLARRGVRPVLMDWGDPGAEERGFSIADYVERRAAPLIDHLSELGDGRKIVVVGHCMSGALATATAMLRPDRVAGVVLLAAPWDFRALRPRDSATPRRADLAALIDGCAAVFGGVPSDVLNTLFFLRDPLQAVRKFPAFQRRGRASAEGRLFVAVEDWLNEGLRLSGPAARTLFLDWGLDNALASGRWRVAGRRVVARSIATPVLVVASKSDTVAPYASSEPALSAFPVTQLLRPSGGHVGMIVGRRGEQELWDPLADWIKARR